MQMPPDRPASRPQTPPPATIAQPWTPPGSAAVETVYAELGAALDGPGKPLNMVGKHMEEVRDQYESAAPAKGVKYHMANDRVAVDSFEDVPGPKGADGKPADWDPFAFAPTYVFDKREDAYPVRPDYDGNADLGDNGGDSLGATKTDHYQDGVIGGKQSLSAGFVVTRKGDYTVLTYSNYYATNKGAHYHKNDYSTAQVYLKPDAKGELKPEFLATSWHYGTQLTPWKDVKKDAQGHPVVAVGLGTHSLQPLGASQAIPEDGLRLNGDGTSTLDGKDTGHALTYDAFQSNVKNAIKLGDDPGSDLARTRKKTIAYGMIAVDPLDPATFDNGKYDLKKQIEGRLSKDFGHVKESSDDPDAGRKLLEDVARKAGVKDPKDYERGFFGKVLGFFGL